MSKTADRIMEVMAELIQTRGYCAVSYQDIADAVGIRKASIHYHFPSKGDLGVAVIQKYNQQLLRQLAKMDEDPNATAADKLDAFIEPYLSFRGKDRRVCLCGALAGEYFALPDAMQAEVTRFIEAHQAWLTKLFEQSKANGSMKFDGSATQTARLFFGALQGALLVKRAAGDDSQILDVAASLKALLH
jgi:TetR/AcrR family transcriptional regulator, transcriptional repressor for nem operon